MKIIYDFLLSKHFKNRFLTQIWFGESINAYQRLKIRVVRVWNFETLMLINLICHTKSKSDLFFIPKIFKSSF